MARGGDVVCATTVASTSAGGISGALDAFGLLMIEQPLAHDDWTATVPQRLRMRAERKIMVVCLALDDRLQ
jgi:hypothetical protein